MPGKDASQADDGHRVEDGGAATMSPTPSSDSVTSGANHREELGRRRPDRHEGCAGDVLGHLLSTSTISSAKKSMAMPTKK